MNTNQILSFEEFSTRGTDVATTEAPTVDTAVVDTTPDAETTTDADTTTDAETTDTEETTTDTETTDSEEETEKEVEAVESNEVNEEEEAETEEVPVATVAEMYEKACTLLKNEADAYENDDYEEHTKGTYMTETANLVAEGHCNAVKEMYGADLTQEQYESACNSIREAYAKKCNEMIEAYGTTESERPESENEPVQGPENSIITKEA